MNSAQPSSKAFWFSYLLLAMLILPGLAQAQKRKNPNTPPPSSAPQPTKPQKQPGGNTGAKKDGSTGPKKDGNTAPSKSGSRSFQPPIGAKVTPNDQGMKYEVGGKQWQTDKGGKLKSFSQGDTTAKFRPDGKISSIRAGNTTIDLRPHGERTIVTMQKDGSKLVTTGKGSGYVEHPFVQNGQTYIHQTRVVNGHYSTYVYARYSYGGGYYYRYVPAYYYGPGFYGWAYSPWLIPVGWGWGWSGAPWFGYYGYYFAPYSSYAAPSTWITDYVLAANLQAAYEVSLSSGPATNSEPTPDGTNGVVLTPEIKQAIAEEVKAQLAVERDAAGSTPKQAEGANPSSSHETAAVPSDGQVPAALDPTQTIFIVSSPLNERISDGAECSLTQGDILTRIDDTPDANQNVEVRVTSSQNNDCQMGSKVMVAVQDLQDMHNNFRAKIDEGLQKLADNQGKKGMPKAPVAERRDNPDAKVQPDLSVEADLQKQQENANKTEKEVEVAANDGISN
jgi:hypothetical protein